ncbi:MAG: RNA polymerase sigma factor [Rikenellaceae bacterium]
MITDKEKEIFKLLDDEQRHSEAFGLIMELYSKPIYWHVRRLVIKHEDAEDVMQECFINVYRSIDGFKRESSLKTWIYRIATNEAIRYLKRQRLDVSSYDDKDRLVNLFESEMEIDFESAEAILQKAILSLPEKQRVVFNLRYYDELSYEQIASITDSSVSTLKTNYHYASSKIKEYVQNNIETKL